MRILIGMPTYDRRIDIDIAKRIIELERVSKHDFDYVFPVSSHISRNRNLVCQESLKGNYDAVLFWDSDIGINDSTFVDKMIETAYNFEAKIVGGAYLMKKQNELVYIAVEKTENSKIDNIREKIIKPRLIEGCGTGIMLIFKEVLQKISDPWFSIIDKPLLEVEPEDFYFCRRAREQGFKIAIDSRFATNHYGASPWKHEI